MNVTKSFSFGKNRLNIYFAPSKTVGLVVQALVPSKIGLHIETPATLETQKSFLP